MNSKIAKLTKVNLRIISLPRPCLPDLMNHLEDFGNRSLRLVRLNVVAAHTPHLAWQIVLAYARRWQIEMAIRYNKCELAFESPRIFLWSSRHKLLLIAALAHALLLSLLTTSHAELRSWLLHTFCPRTGKRSRETPVPLYRLRLALRLLWLFHPSPFLSHL